MNMTVAEYQAQAAKPKRSKYGNKKTIVDGLTFASARESRRWIALRLLERAGEITDLKRQQTWPLDVNGHSICRYRPDFEYRDKAGALIVEDSKGYATDEYKIKKALMLAIHGVEIVET